jgi:hypothetical protein
MSSTAKLILNDPESFHILTTDMKETIIKAAINKVNIQAAMTRTKAIQNIRKDFTVRNTFTARQVQYTQMPQGRLSGGITGQPRTNVRAHAPRKNAQVHSPAPSVHAIAPMPASNKGRKPIIFPCVNLPHTGP